MWVVGHAQVGWLGAWLARLERRDRIAVAWCAAAPDLDAVTLVAGVDAYYAGHHVYLHNLAAAAAIPAVAACFARRRIAVYGLGGVAVLLHLLSDGFGLLPLRPLWPFDHRMWWPNGLSYGVAFVGEVLVPAALIAWQVALFRRGGASVLEMLPGRVEVWVKARFAGKPA